MTRTLTFRLIKVICVECCVLVPATSTVEVVGVLHGAWVQRIFIGVFKLPRKIHSSSRKRWNQFNAEAQARFHFHPKTVHIFTGVLWEKVCQILCDVKLRASELVPQYMPGIDIFAKILTGAQVRFFIREALARCQRLRIFCWCTTFPWLSDIGSVNCARAARYARHPLRSGSVTSLCVRDHRPR